MSHREDLTATVGAFVDELVLSGLRHAVISPGSRSTPLALAMVAHPGLKEWLLVDERSAGFFALGLGKALGEPAALLCTSGTATANYFPAVAEAKLARVPLVVLTADRPHELRDVGAPQSMDQIGMYGTHVKWFMDMALPDCSELMLRYVRTTAARAVATAQTGPKGPIHLNLPYREPLMPDLASPTFWQGGRREEGTTPYVRVTAGERELSGKELDQWAQSLSQWERGLIVVGPQEAGELGPAVHRLAESLRFPVLADPLSRLRNGTHPKEWILEGYDAFLREKEAVEKLAPEVVIRFGAMPVSKAVLLYLKEHPSARQIVIDPDGGWRDPSLLSAEMIYTDPIRFCTGVAHRIPPRKESAWAQLWQELNRETTAQLAKAGQMEAPFEGRVFLELAKLLPEEGILFAGNSMPVRDLDSFLLNSDRCLHSIANRGISGIDGVVSTALGVAAARSHVTLVLGDLSFFHDLNGLLAAKLHALHATIVVINNDGGGIFSLLPQASQTDPDTFETLFGTPLGLDFEHAVHMYGGHWERPDSWESFRKAYVASLEGTGLHVIEVRTDRQENADLHQEIWKQIGERVRKRLEEVEG